MNYNDSKLNHNYENDFDEEADLPPGVSGQASKAPWTPEEDVILIQLVERIGA
jgi:hypothetical protein